MLGPHNTTMEHPTVTPDGFSGTARAPQRRAPARWINLSLVVEDGTNFLKGKLKRSMLQPAKRIFERVLTDSGACSAYRRLTRKSVILAYHNVVPADTEPVGDAGLHVDGDRFKRQLDHLASTHEIVPLRRLLAGDSGEGRNQAAVTFDDAYRGAVEIGLREIRRRGLHATIFVSPGILGDETLWWDALARDGRLDPELRAFALEELEGDQVRARQWAVNRGLDWQRSPSHARTVTEEELLESAAGSDVSLEAHGWKHRNLARLDPRTLREECERIADWLGEQAGEQAPILAYPYGRVSPDAESEARLHFDGAALVTGGAFRPESLANPYRIPRINVDAGLSVRGFEVRTSGVRS